jgi:PIN domain nuclease of toxin-antitoxin system
MKYLLDTHVWIWWHTNPGRLSPQVHALIAHPGDYEELLLSAISPWELCRLVQKKRIELSVDAGDWIQEALRMPSLRLAPLSPHVAYVSTNLPGAFHDDPADQIIVATARTARATVLTADERIRKYAHVASLW